MVHPTVVIVHRTETEEVTTTYSFYENISEGATPIARVSPAQVTLIMTKGRWN